MTVILNGANPELAKGFGGMKDLMDLAVIDRGHIQLNSPSNSLTVTLCVIITIFVPLLPERKYDNWF